MNVFKTLGKLYNIFSGEIPPYLVAYGLVLGLFFGLMPQGLFEPVTYIFVALFLLTRASVGFVLVTALITRMIMSFGMWAVVDGTGRAVLNAEALQGLLTALVNAPFIAWLGLDRYAAMGGLIWALVLSGICFIPMLRFVRWFRADFLPGAKDTRIGRFLTENFLGKILRTVFFGVVRVKATKGLPA